MSEQIVLLFYILCHLQSISLFGFLFQQDQSKCTSWEEHTHSVTSALYADEVPWFKFYRKKKNNICNTLILIF